MVEKRCPITGDSMRHAFQMTVLQKYEVDYYYCESSGLLQTQTPYWLKEAYDSPISVLDTGLVQRNLDNASRLTPLLHRLFDDDARFLDLAGGYGLLTRLMRDRGFDCYSIDEYCENTLAAGFEPSHPFRAAALFSFEVLEHLTDPLEFLRKSFDEYSTGTIFFSTVVFREDRIPAADWWYYAPESGQHITFYQERSLELIADALSCNFYSLGNDLFLLSDRELSLRDRLLLTNKRLSRLYAWSVERGRRGLSKTEADHRQLKRDLEQRSLPPR